MRATELLPCAARSSTPNGGLQGVAQVLPVLTRRIPQTQTGTVAMSRFCGSSLGRSAGQRSRRDQSSRGGGTAMTTRSFSLPVTAASLTEPAAQATEWIPFVLSPESIEEGCQQTGLLRTKYLTSLLKHFTALARPPISNFRVAAIGLGASGRAYAGVNLEIPGLPLHNSVHAEQFVVANAMQHGETRIQQMLVNHPPCGHCRQVRVHVMKLASQCPGMLRFSLFSPQPTVPCVEDCPCSLNHRFDNQSLDARGLKRPLQVLCEYLSLNPRRSFPCSWFTFSFSAVLRVSPCFWLSISLRLCSSCKSCVEQRTSL